MTSDTPWSGLPPDPTRAGWHLLRWVGNDYWPVNEAWHYDPSREQAWARRESAPHPSLPPNHIAPNYTYIAPLISTPEEAAALLRAAGWTCVAPADEAIPEPEVGQLWITPRTDGGWRTRITAVTADGTVCFISTGGLQGQSSADSWNEWARKTGARPA